jgi:hypothetical protein
MSCREIWWLQRIYNPHYTRARHYCCPGTGTDRHRYNQRQRPCLGRGGALPPDPPGLGLPFSARKPRRVWPALVASFSAYLFFAPRCQGANHCFMTESSRRKKIAAGCATEKRRRLECTHTRDALFALRRSRKGNRVRKGSQASTRSCRCLPRPISSLFLFLARIPGRTQRSILIRHSHGTGEGIQICIRNRVAGPRDAPLAFPTAQTSLAESAATPDRKLPAIWGLGTTLQFVPSQCTMSASWLALLG